MLLWREAAAAATTFIIFVGLFGCGSGRSLSYRMKASEAKACFYAVVKPNVELGKALLQFYYAASDAKRAKVVYVDTVVTGPSGQKLHSQQRQTHAEVNISPSEAGPYEICLSHNESPSEMDLDIDITLPFPPTKEDDKLEKAVSKLQRELSDLVHTLRYIKNRERRNLETVESIENWIFYISSFEVLLIIGMSVLQVTVLRMFFSGSAKQRV